MAKSVTTTYYENATATCQNCGSEYTLGMTSESITVEICGSCHPFYSGAQTLIDTAGRIEKFQERFGNTSSNTPVKKKTKKTKQRKFRQSLADLSTDDDTNTDVEMNVTSTAEGEITSTESKETE